MDVITLQPYPLKKLLKILRLVICIISSKRHGLNAGPAESGPLGVIRFKGRCRNWRCETRSRLEVAPGVQKIRKICVLFI